MALKKVNSRVQVLDLEGSKIHALRPRKEHWDEYADELFVRDPKTGEFEVKSSKGIRQLYRICVKKLENVDIEEDDGTLTHFDEITDPEKIISFILGLGDADAGRKIDNWLLGLGELTANERKN